MGNKPNKDHWRELSEYIDANSYNLDDYIIVYDEHAEIKWTRHDNQEDHRRGRGIRNMVHGLFTQRKTIPSA